MPRRNRCHQSRADGCDNDSGRRVTRQHHEAEHEGSHGSISDILHDPMGPLVAFAVHESKFFVAGGQVVLKRLRDVVLAVSRLDHPSQPPDDREQWSAQRERDDAGTNYL